MFFFSPIPLPTSSHENMTTRAHCNGSGTRDNRLHSIKLTSTIPTMEDGSLLLCGVIWVLSYIECYSLVVLVPFPGLFGYIVYESWWVFVSICFKFLDLDLRNEMSLCLLKVTYL